jgi:predicted kinase
MKIFEKIKNNFFKKKDKILIILRGLPGSGKSTVADILSENGKYPICCADDWYVKEYGYYKWNFSDIGKAHKYSKELCEKSMKKSIRKIIIANTNITEKDYKPYVEMASTYNYKVFSLVVENLHGHKSVHNVPDETLEKMKTKFKYNI